MRIPVLKTALALVIVATTAFTSCESDNESWSERVLTGVWHTRDDYGDLYTKVRFSYDGTGVISQYDYGMLVDKAYFYWTSNRHHIHFDFDDRPDERWNIEFDGRNAFRLYFHGGDYTYFVRDY